MRLLVFEIVLTILGIIASAVYVGYLAYAIDAIPLWLIIIATYLVAIYELALEFRETANHATRNAKRR